MRYRKMLLGAIVFALLVPAAAAAAVVPAEDARIVSVTVYRDRAEVVREVILSVPAGSSTIAFNGIPVRVQADTLRVSAEGVPAVLGALEVVQRADEPVEPPEYQAALAEVRRLEQDIAVVDENGVVDEELRAFLRSLASTAAGGGEDAAPADPEAIGKLYALMQTKYSVLAGNRVQRKERRRDLEEDLKVARAKLSTLKPGSSIRSRTAEIQVEAERAGSLKLRLAYLVPGASWRPGYRATLDVDADRVNLVSEAIVRQNSGEDWSGVDLQLSTASPARGVQPPNLPPWILRPVQPRVTGYAKSDLVEEIVVTRQAPMALEPEMDEAVAAGELQSDIVRSAYNVSFRVPGSSDIPSDGGEHRVVLRSEALDAEVEHRVVPGMAAKAYLTAKVASPEDYPLLAGQVRVLAGGAYLGRFNIPETGPGQELKLPFGVDNRIEVVRVPEPKYASKKGFIGRFRVVEKRERTLVHNRMDRPVVLVLEDRLPVSEREDITVEAGKGTTPGYEKDDRRPGILLWTLELAPGEKREVILEYTVKHPRDMNLPGLD